MRRAAFLATLTLLLVGTAEAKTVVAPDEYVEVTLARAKQPATIFIKLKQSSLLAPYVLFPPSELGNLVFAAKDSDNKPIDLYSPVPLKSGLYSIAISSDAPSPTPFNVMFRSLGMADDFSRNRTMADADDVDLPLSKVLALRSYKDQAWYSFDVPGPGVLLVRLANLGRGPGAEITVEANIKDKNSKELAVGGTVTTADSNGAATQYFEIKEKGVWRVGAARTGPPAQGDEAASRLDIVFYPDRPDEDLPAFVALGASPDDPSIQQLSLRMRAAGRRVIVTNDPREIERALFTNATKTLREARSAGHVWLYWLGGILLLLAAAGAAYYFWWRKKARP